MGTWRNNSVWGLINLLFFLPSLLIRPSNTNLHKWSVAIGSKGLSLCTVNISSLEDCWDCLGSLVDSVVLQGHPPSESPLSRTIESTGSGEMSHTLWWWCSVRKLQGFIVSTEVKGLLNVRDSWSDLFFYPLTMSPCCHLCVWPRARESCPDMPFDFREWGVTWNLDNCRAFSDFWMTFFSCSIFE